MSMMSRKDFIRFTFSCGALFCAGGCVAPMQYPPLDPRIYVAENLRGNVVITDVRFSPGNSDHLLFQATVANNTRSLLPIKYRVVWVDADGIEVDTVLSSWQYASIMPKDITAIKAVSPRPEIVNFRCYVEWAR